MDILIGHLANPLGAMIIARLVKSDKLLSARGLGTERERAVTTGGVKLDGAKR